MDARQRILIVDDDPTNVAIIEESLEEQDLQIETAATGEEALQVAPAFRPDVVLLDIMMPGLDGYEVCRQIREQGADGSPKIILVSGRAMLHERLNGYEVGADDYVSKPFNEEELLAKVRVFLRLNAVENQLRQLNETLQARVDEQTLELMQKNEQLKQDIVMRQQAEDEVQRTLSRLQKAMDGVVQAMALTVERRDPYTAGHQRRVSDLANCLALEMGLPDRQIEGIRLAGLIHDLGKISVPAEILSKPGRLTEIEFSLIKSHPQVGYEILQEIEFSWPVADIVLQHHERLDGSGYPLGLQGEEILVEARIMAVADVVEAMASHRPYRPALGVEKALEEITRNRGKAFDPQVVDACLRQFNSKGFQFKQ